MKIYCISDNTDTRTGLRLAGIDGCIAHTGEEFEAAVNAALRDRDIGILLVMENLARQFPDTISRIKMTERLPLVVEIPDRHGSGRNPDFITDYIREAIGVKIGG